MSAYEASPPSISGPAAGRHAFLKRAALLTFGGLMAAAVVGGVSLFTVAPAVMSAGRWGGTIFVLVAFAFAHWVCRRMVYGGAKMVGFILACVAEGVSFGFLLLTAVAVMGVSDAIAMVVQALGLVAATAGGMLVYVWFNKGEMKLLGAFLSMSFIPMLVLMVIGAFWMPFGGTIGIVISAVFVLVSAGGLLWKLNWAIHGLETDQHVEAAYEITMSLLILLWNVISLLMRLRR